MPADCTPLVNSIGVLFQVMDTYRNFDNYADHKGFSAIIQATAADPPKPFLLSILRQGRKTIA
jgi:hypothetical protein